MPRRDVWFVIPSANPENCRKVLPVWRERGYRIAVLQNFQRGEIPADITVWYDSYPGWPGSVNILCREVVPRECDLIVTGGDDMLPDPDHTAQELAAQFFDRFPDGFGVMQPHGDEFLCARRYCGSPFIGRAWFENMYGGQGPMHPGYHHNYADNELYWTAKGLGVLWTREDLSHFHDHFSREGREAPAYWGSVRSKDLDDCLLYYARVHQHFPGHEPRAGFTVPRPYDTTMPRAEMLLLAEQRLFNLMFENPFAEAIQKKLERCAEEAQDLVAIYGHGYHTQVGIAALRDPPVKIACIIDDNAAKQGKLAWGYPVVSREQAIDLGVKAVVLSAQASEEMLWENASVFRERGIPVHRLYGG